MEVVTSFDGEFRFLSNFFVEPDGTTVEHEFAASKTHDLHEKALILMTKTPGQAKRMGRKVTLRPDWEDVKVQVMRDLVLRKFFDHPELAQRLVDTGDALLIEGNTWHDNFWGACTCERCDTMTKLDFNNLGRILMEIRSLILSFEKGT